MNRTPESQTHQDETPRKQNYRKIVLIASLSLLSLIVLLGLSGWFYVRSGRVNIYIGEQVKSALSEYGVRAEFGGFELAWGVRTARLRDVKLYNQQNGQLIVTIDRAELVTEVK